MIKNLIFDFGKVLVDYDYMSVIDTWFDDKERERRFLASILTPYWGERMDREVVPFVEIIREMKEKMPQFSSEIDRFDTQYLDFVTGEVPGMRCLLKELKRQGYHLYGLTNWCSKVHDTMHQFEIFDLLDGQVISSEEHYIKPEPEIYLRLFERFGLNPSECVFADDKAENVEGARALGMESILFVNAEQYARELARIIAITR